MKTKPEADLYVFWTTVSDGPTWIGSRENALKNFHVAGNEHFDGTCRHCGQAFEGHAARRVRLADKYGTSAVNEETGESDCGWGSGPLWLQNSYDDSRTSFLLLPRENLHDFALAALADDIPKALSFCEDMEEEEEDHDV